MTESIIEIESKITEEVKHLIQNGYQYFGAGGARGFDTLAAEVILKLKVMYPEIHLILVLPFDEQYKKEKNWEKTEIEQYHQLRKSASKVVVLERTYSSGVYYRRNRHLVDNSSYCIAYMVRENTGTGYTVRYAIKQGVSVANIALNGALR